MAIDSDTAVKIMKSELSSLPVYYYKPHSRDISIRCPFCGDSKKDPRHAHFGIAVVPVARSQVVTFAYRCFLCNRHAGGMSVEVAKKIGIQDSELLEYLSTINSKIKSSIQVSGSNVFAKRFEYDLSNTESEKADIERKKDYLWQRLRSRDICDYPEKFKIVLDLRQFFVKNNLSPNTEYGRGVNNTLRHMQSWGIGFVSFDSTRINFRDISPHPQNRYMQYRIYKTDFLEKKYSNQETSPVYIIPTVIDIMAKRQKLIMAEGVFDILRIYTDFYKSIKSSGYIFAAVANSHGFASTIIKLLEHGVMFDEIEIFSDKDVDVSQYKRFVKPIAPDAILTLHYNKLAKDVGDIREPLQLTTITL